MRSVQPSCCHCLLTGSAIRGLLLSLLIVAACTGDANCQQESTPATPADVSDGTAAGKSAGDEQAFQLLLDDKWPAQWKWFSSAPDVPLPKVWTISKNTQSEDLILICSGSPKGFLYTTEAWSDFEMQLDWRYPKDADGNSGVLLFVQDESRVWPTSIQVQLHQPKAGSVFPSGDAMSDNTTETDLARPVGEWNSCRIVTRQGTISVEINGKRAGEITGATPATGKIALQSEGSEVQFRRLRIRSIATEETNDASEKPAASLDDSSS
jgi:hypothetical protein